MLDAFWNAIDHPSDYHAAVAVAGQHDVVQIFIKNQIDDVIDMRLQINIGTVEVFALAKAGEGGAVHSVAVIGEKLAGALPFPGACGRAVDYDDRVLLSARRRPRR